jgi:hypothetical protein
MSTEKKVFLDKSYGWEDSYDLNRDLDEAIEGLVDQLESDEWKGQIQITLTYIPEE